jgi:hypothetical protein
MLVEREGKRDKVYVLLLLYGEEDCNDENRIFPNWIEWLRDLWKNVEEWAKELAWRRRIVDTRQYPCESLGENRWAGIFAMGILDQVSIVVRYPVRALLFATHFLVPTSVKFNEGECMAINLAYSTTHFERPRYQSF